MKIYYVLALLLTALQINAQENIAQLASLPYDAQKEIILKIFEQSQTAEEGLRAVAKLAQTHKPLYEILRDPAFLADFKKTLLRIFPDKEQEDNLYALFDAAVIEGNAPVVALFIDMGFDVNHVFTQKSISLTNDTDENDEEESSLLLHDAVMFGQAHIVQMLLDAGAEVDAADSDGTTALMAAAQYGQSEIVTILINAGADIDAVDNTGGTPLMYAATYDEPKVIEILLAAGAQVNVMDEEGKTPFLNAVESGHPQIMRRLLKAGADIDVTDSDGKTALMLAAEYGHPEIIKILVEMHPDKAYLNKTTPDGITALMLAAQYGHPEVIKLLLEMQPDKTYVNATTQHGTTALMLAVGGGHVEVVTLLLAAGADINAHDSIGNSALLAALGLPRSTGLKSKMVQILIDNKVDVNVPYHNGMTMLMLAVIFNEIILVDMLLKAGANPRAVDHNGRTALSIAQQTGDQAIIQAIENALQQYM